MLASSSGLEAVTVYRPHWGPNDTAEPATSEELLRSGVFPRQLLENDVATEQKWVVFEAEVKLDDMTPDNVIGEGSFRTAYRLWDSAGQYNNNSNTNSTNSTNSATNNKNS